MCVSIEKQDPDPFSLGMVYKKGCVSIDDVDEIEESYTCDFSDGSSGGECRFFCQGFWCNEHMPHENLALRLAVPCGKYIISENYIGLSYWLPLHFVPAFCVICSWRASVKRLKLYKLEKKK